MLLPPAVENPEEARPLFSSAAARFGNDLMTRGVDRVNAERAVHGHEPRLRGRRRRRRDARPRGYRDLREPARMFDPALSPQPPSVRRHQAESHGASSVSPLDLRQRRFRSRFNGFDKVEVAAFLVAVADDYEQALREADHLRQELARMEADPQGTPRAARRPCATRS